MGSPRFSHDEISQLFAQVEGDANIGSWVWYLDNNEVKWSPQLFKILGVPITEKPTHELYFNSIHPEDRQLQAGQVGRDDWPKGELPSIECRVRHGNGDIRYVKIHGRTLQNDLGETDVILGTMIDVTASRENEKLRIEAARLQAMGSMAAGIGHDFNNFLQIIMSGVSYLQTHGKNQGFGREQLEKIRAIENSSLLCSALSKKMISLTEGSETQAYCTDLPASLNKVKEILKTLVGERTKVIAQSSGELFAHIDYLDFNQILVNLVKNSRIAIDKKTNALATPEDFFGEINIKLFSASIKAGEVANLNAGTYICLQVTDNGCGIPAESIGRVFDPFFSTNRNQGGSGLGLSRVYAMLQKYKGGFAIQSDAATGTVFRLYFHPGSRESLINQPQSSVGQVELRGEPSEEPSEKPTVELAPQSLPRVIYVEDNVELQEVVLDVLNLHGFDIKPFRSGEELVTYIDPLAQPDFDVVLTDVAMSGINGVEMAMKLWQKWPKVKIIFLTGYGEPEEISMLSSLVNQYEVLSKPIEMEVLVQKIIAISALPE